MYTREIHKQLSIEELKTAITAKIRAIPKEECVKVIDNFARRVQSCLQRNGGYLKHILEKLYVY